MSSSHPGRSDLKNCNLKFACNIHHTLPERLGSDGLDLQRPKSDRLILRITTIGQRWRLGANTLVFAVQLTILCALGFGFGTFLFVNDESGKTVAYGWFGTASRGTLPTSVVYGRLTR